MTSTTRQAFTWVAALLTSSLLLSTASCIAQADNAKPGKSNAPSDTAVASDFIYPQSVYQSQVETTRYDNGGIVNKAALDKIKTTQAQEPQIIEVTEGIWVLVGYHWVYATIIEGETGLIIYDVGDDIKEGNESPREFRRAN